MNHRAVITVPQELVCALQTAKHVVVFTGAREARIYSSWRAITWLGRSAALVFLQISRYLLQKPPCIPSRSKRRASTRINPRFPRVSAESGIPTFRDALTGLWERFDATDLATPDAFLKDEELVWGWYEWRRMKVLRAQPNPAHLAIAALAQHVPTLTVVTQNVDDLHERAGSVGVLHLHGSLHSPRCADCGQAHILPPGIPGEPDGGRRLRPPPCRHCGGAVRPGVVWFDEDLPIKELTRIFHATPRYRPIGVELGIPRA